MRKKIKRESEKKGERGNLYCQPLHMGYLGAAPPDNPVQQTKF
jgi:hypothetical protein